MIEEISGTNKQREKEQEQDLALPVCVRVRDNLPGVLTTYTVIVSNKPAST